MKKQKENSREGITWSEMGKQNVQAEKVYCYPRAEKGTRACASTVFSNLSKFPHENLGFVPGV